MSNSKEVTTAKALDELYNFGARCYKKGYYRACLELFSGAIVSTAMIALIEYVAKKIKDDKTDE